jgi:protoporphyrinogen oxidase
MAGAGDPVPTVVVGAGPAGLTAAYQLVKQHAPVVVVEAGDQVGGISATIVRDGWRFDIGGHRFFTKQAPVEELWHEILPDEDFLTRPRMSRIYYRGQLFDYPLRAMNALRGLGPVEAVRCFASYGWARLRPPKDQSHFEGWVSARFGYRLYSIFFKTYTEKVWGMPATRIQADWAAQRIKNLSLLKAVGNALSPRHNQKRITSLIEEFQYPKHGPGMMWEHCAERVTELGGSVQLLTRAASIHRTDGRVSVVTVEGPDGRYDIAADHVISTMPLSDLVACLKPAAPEPVRRAAEALAYRDFLTVALVVPERYSFPDNWIYIHDPGVRVGRIQNFGAWSPYMVKDGRTCLGLEYFVFAGDQLWNSADDDLLTLAREEISRLGLVPAAAVEAGYVVRMPKAYPVYDEDYQTNVATIREWLAKHTPNLHTVGRNGLHRYNNQDHSMLTAMLAVENIVQGTRHDVWTINVDADYHEEKRTNGRPVSRTGRDAPTLPKAAVSQTTLRRSA